MTDSIFLNYWNEVSSLLGGKPNKSMAISLSENPQNDFNGATAIRRLYQSLACVGWETNSGKNWIWRTEAPTYKTSSPEVTLEREIVAADTTHEWTCKMSTASGIQGQYLNKRRAIDLVRKSAPDRFAFIELKVGSDNPLYAAFEILGYALAYQHARQHKWRGHGRYDVLQANIVNLVVLGPSEWYEYKKGGINSRRNRFRLGWLTKELGVGLELLTDQTPVMHISFEEFSDLGKTELTAKKIIKDAFEWTTT